MSSFCLVLTTAQGATTQKIIEALLSRELAACIQTMPVRSHYVWQGVLRDEAEIYAHKLREAGVEVRMQRWEGMNHGFFFWVGIVDAAGVAMDEACAWLKQIFGKNN